MNTLGVSDREIVSDRGDASVLNEISHRNGQFLFATHCFLASEYSSFHDGVAISRFQCSQDSANMKPFVYVVPASHSFSRSVSMLQRDIRSQDRNRCGIERFVDLGIQGLEILGNDVLHEQKPLYASVASPQSI